MARDFAQIERAAALSAQTVTSDNVLSLPPGYIQGFNVTLRKDYTVTVSGGAANVSGRQVKMESDHQLTLQDWVVPRMDTPQHYYIYLSKEGDIRVDIVKPKFNSFYSYYEQPDTGWRVIGKLFVKNTDIVYAIQDVSRSGRSVTVAPADYVGYADYYCDGTNDEILINAAILYVFTAYGGGTVTLQEGIFNISNSILALSYVRIEGMGDGTVLRDSSSTNQYTVLGNGSASANVILMGISNLRIDSSLNTSAAHYAIFATYVDGVSINRVSIKPAQASMYIQQSSSITINDCNIDGGSISTLLGTGIIVDSCSSVVIEGNIIKNLSGYAAISASCAGIWISNTSSSIVKGNSIYNCLTSVGALIACGIRISSSYNVISSNRIELIKNTGTAANVHGIWVESNTSNKITDNYCYNNGSDTGIANTNGNNFSDSGTDTQVYSNSWQNPNSGEPNQGELHYLPQNTNTTGAFLLNAVTTTAAWVSVSCGSIVPVGAHTLFANVRVNAIAQAAGFVEHAVAFSNDTSATPSYGTHHPALELEYTAAAVSARHILSVPIPIPLDSNRKFYYYAYTRTNATNCWLYLTGVGYYS